MINWFINKALFSITSIFIKPPTANSTEELAIIVRDNSLRESFNANRSKLLLALAVIWLTNSALVENLNAQTPKNWANPKMEQVDKNDILQVKIFMSDLNKALSKYNIQITLSPEQEKLAINGVGRMDSRGKQEAIKLIVNMITTGKSTPESTIQKDVPVKDRDEVIGFVLDAIEQAYDKDTAKLENIMANADLYTDYETRLNEVTNTFRKDRSIETDRLNNSIAQKEQNIAQKEQNINQMDKQINQKNQEAETRLLKLYNLNPNDAQLKTLATNAKKNFINTNYKYSEKTAEIFTKLGIK